MPDTRPADKGGQAAGGGAKTTELERGRIEDLVEGAPAPRDIYSERGMLLLSRGSVITRHLIDRLLRSRVEAIFFGGEPAETPVAPPPAPAVVVERYPPVPYEYILGRIQEVYEDRSLPRMVGEATLTATRELMGSIFDFASAEDPVYNPEEVQRLSSALIDEIDANRTAMLNLQKLDQFDTYTTNHSINVAFLATAFATFLGYEREALERLAVGALLHDIGKIRVGAAIVRKQGTLDPGERAAMQRHPEYSREIILARGGVPRSAAVYAFQHHERMHGHGYPAKLVHHQINPESYLLALCDIYDAVTSLRSYDRSHSPHLAVYRIMQAADQDFPRDLAHQFVNFLTVLPTGSTVRLETGEVGIVIRPNRQDQWRPVIKLVMDAEGSRIDGDLLDLTLERRKISHALDTERR